MPQVVALARLLISPYWGSLAVSFSHIEHSLFAQEMRDTVAPGYQWPQPRFSKDPLHRWIIGGNRNPPSTSFRDAKDQQIAKLGPVL